MFQGYEKLKYLGLADASVKQFLLVLSLHSFAPILFLREE